MNNLSENDMLKYAIENGMINLSYVQEQVEMSKREAILKQHPYSIWFGSDNNWHTYLPDEKKGRVPKKRKTEEDIKQLIIDFYKKDQEKPKSFADVYAHWRSVQDVMVSDNTTVKYDSDYLRYFQDTDFAKKPITKLTEEDIKLFIVQTVKSQKLCKKACKTLVWYIRQVVNSARINHDIKDNPMEFQTKQFYKYCTERQRPKGKTIVTEEEMKLLYEQFYKDYQEMPSYIPTYAVQFATLTGMRVGEIAALRWDCIKSDRIIIDKSEKYNRKTKSFYISTTKNDKTREFPITTEIRELLDRVKKVELQNGFLCEWVFANEDGRIHAPVITSCSQNKCQQLGIEEKGIHAYRRTINSNMRHNGVSAATAASLLGHTEAVNEKYYTFDVSTFDERKNIVSEINKRIACG